MEEINTNIQQRHSNKNELNQIKKLYGEKMMQFCRTNFGVILDNDGKLTEILKNNFEPSKNLLADIQKDLQTHEFINFVLQKFDGSLRSYKKTNKNPFELMEEAGYHLVECKTEEDVEQFRKYYKQNELLCTFDYLSTRLAEWDVFFATKHNIDDIKRENFHTPEREDEYGTSCISLQFSRGKDHFISIKNRYNHTVENCDATFANNPENIISGLYDSFENYLGITFRKSTSDFYLNNYIKDDNDTYHKYNIRQNNIYYLTNNKVMDCGEITQFNKDDYILCDHYLICKNKEEGLSVTLYDDRLRDSFCSIYEDIQKIEDQLFKDENGNVCKKIEITNGDGNVSSIILNNQNNIIAYANNTIETLPDNFMSHCLNIAEIKMKNVKEIGDDFLIFNTKLKNFYAPNLENIGNKFCYFNYALTNLN